MIVLKQAGIALLLGAAVASAWLSALGVLVTRGAFGQLHYVSLAAGLLPVLAAAAIVLDWSSWQTTIKAVGVALILIASTPAVTHATARAVFVRETKGQRLTRASDQKGEPR